MALCALPLGLALPAWAAAKATTDRATASAPTLDILARLAALEQTSGGRLGVSCLDAAGTVHAAWREHDAFPFCSTFKVLLVGLVLRQAIAKPHILEQRIFVRARDIISYSPVTEQHVGTLMRTADICAAALQYSDNTAANLLLDLCGGPPAVTAFARTLGATSFRLDRREPDLNTCIADDLRDTASPRSMAESLRQLLTGTALLPAHKEVLLGWLKGNRTGDRRIRAGLPAHWKAGDKTGSGPNGTTNDLAVLLPAQAAHEQQEYTQEQAGLSARPHTPYRAPLFLAVYLTNASGDLTAREAVCAKAAQIITELWG